MTVDMRALRRPAHHRATPLRLSPHHGKPRCLLEQFLQHVWHRKLLWYIAFIVTLVLVFQLLLDSHLHRLVYG